MIALAARAAEDMRSVDHAPAGANRGMTGDRYAEMAGTFTPTDDAVSGYDLTLTVSEALDSLTLPSGDRIGYAEARRNLATRGIDLAALVGRRFRVGSVECLGQRLCERCSDLERLTAEGPLRALIHCAGLRADVGSDGEQSTGAPIGTLE